MEVKPVREITLRAYQKNNIYRGAYDLVQLKSAFILFAKIYLPIKILLVVIAIVVLPELFDRSYFKYIDFPTYSNCDLRSPNGLFSMLICALGISDITNTHAVMIAIILNTLKDCGFVLLTANILLRRSTILFCVLLAAHPYLALYHAKLSTSTFACVGVMLLFWHISQTGGRRLGFDIAFIVLTGMRNALGIMFGLFYLFEIGVQLKRYCSNNSIIKTELLFNICSLLAIVLITQLPENNYANSFIASSETFSLNMTYFLNLIHTSVKPLDYVLSSLMVVTSHLTILLGFREAAFTQYPNFFMPFDQNALFHVIMAVGLIPLHSIGLFYFIKYYCKINFRHLSYLSLIIPSLFLVAHMRYLLPLMPLALYGFTMFIEKFFFVSQWEQNQQTHTLKQ